MREPRNDPKRMRRSLTNVGGDIETSGDAEQAGELAHALEVSPRDEEERGDGPDRAHVHGFHTYPARMHPETAARLVTAFSNPGSRVLDPFCGSGTVLVESMIAGRVALGVDLNPFAVELSRVKTTMQDGASRERMNAAAEDIQGVSDARRKARAGASRRFPKDDVDTFDPHVLLELDSIKSCLDGVIEGVGEKEAHEILLDDPTRNRLFLALSAILTKVSKRRAETTAVLGEKRLAAGYTTKLFVKKTRELGDRLGQLAALLPPKTKAPRIVQGDAGKLDGIVEDSIDAIVTSPPYAGTYDYLAHHALRLRWLGLSGRMMFENEMGARRDYAELDAATAKARYTNELTRLFTACARVAKKDAALVLLMGDSATKTTALYADDFVHDVAIAHGVFAPVARASQQRTHFHGPSARAFRDRPRSEHLLLLRKR